MAENPEQDHSKNQQHVGLNRWVAFQEGGYLP